MFKIVSDYDISSKKVGTASHWWNKNNNEKRYDNLDETKLKKCPYRTTPKSLGMDTHQKYKSKIHLKIKEVTFTEAEIQSYFAISSSKYWVSFTSIFGKKWERKKIEMEIPMEGHQELTVYINGSEWTINPKFESIGKSIIGFSFAMLLYRLNKLLRAHFSILY